MNDDDEVPGLVETYAEADLARAWNPQAARETLSKLDDLVASREKDLVDLRARHAAGKCSSADFLEFKQRIEQNIMAAERSRHLFERHAARFEQKESE